MTLDTFLLVQRARLGCRHSPGYGGPRVINSVDWEERMRPCERHVDQLYERLRHDGRTGRPLRFE
jgi:hypothetical protein